MTGFAYAAVIWGAGLPALYLFLLWRRYRTIRAAELPALLWILPAGAGHRARLRRELDSRWPAEMLAGPDGLIIVTRRLPGTPLVLTDYTRIAKEPGK